MKIDIGNYTFDVCVIFNFENNTYGCEMIDGNKIDSISVQLTDEQEKMIFPGGHMKLSHGYGTILGALQEASRVMKIDKYIE